MQNDSPPLDAAVLSALRNLDRQHKSIGEALSQPHRTLTDAELAATIIGRDLRALQNAISDRPIPLAADPALAAERVRDIVVRVLSLYFFRFENVRVRIPTPFWSTAIGRLCANAWTQIDPDAWLTISEALPTPDAPMSSTASILEREPILTIRLEDRPARQKARLIYRPDWEQYLARQEKAQRQSPDAAE